MAGGPVPLRRLRPALPGGLGPAPLLSSRRAPHRASPSRSCRSGRCSSTRTSSPTARSRSTYHARGDQRARAVPRALRALRQHHPHRPRGQRRVGTLTVLLLVMLGARLYNRRVGLLAGFLLGACVLHVQNSHYMTTRRLPDVPGHAGALLPGRRRGARLDARLRLRRPRHRPRDRDEVQRPAAARAARRRLPGALVVASDRFVAGASVAGRCWRWCCIALAFAAGQPYALPRLRQLLPRHRRAEPHGAQRRPAALHQPVHRRAEVRLRPRAAGAVGHGAAARAGGAAGRPPRAIVGAVRERSATDSSCSPGWCRSSSSPARST